MADDALYSVTTAWTATENGGGDITVGTFTIFNQSDARIEVTKSDSIPTAPNGVKFMVGKGDAIKDVLAGSQKLWVRTDQTGGASIGVTTA